MSNEREQLQKLLVEALEKLYSKDLYLIKMPKHNCTSSKNTNEPVYNYTGEREIVFRLGIYLYEIMNKKLMSILKLEKDVKLNLDCEYNRNLCFSKKVNNIKRYPDLILHNRGSNDNNILVIEAKTWWNPNTENDEEKLELLTSQKGEYKYKYGLSIKFNTSNVNLVWFEDGIKCTSNKIEILLKK
ncbi:hypothetical protein KM800_13990 [Clostridium tyrobutyricum]|uniref:hypothetical protein n=1 Tax=Clostridium tyrobutyricum TaxID=1519 RepID=UPI001C38459F|nr:hypothetical protein [Clostridium tyrobutyricum]MBV4420418.1 hypothetical protein [Clostridium tyrobutyricum]